MDAPKVHYAVSPDGTRIAYAEFGSGEPVIYIQGVGHLGREWQMPEVADWLTRMSARMRLIKVDQRNSGLSQRNVPMGKGADDILAVADSLALERFSLFLSGPICEAGLQIALEHPERVNRMVMWEFVTVATWAAAGRIRANLVGSDVDADATAEILARTIVGDRYDLLPRWVEFVGAAFSAADFGRSAPSPKTSGPDLLERAGSIGCPVLVVAQEEGPYGLEDPQRLTASLPKAELIVHGYRPLYPPVLPPDAPVMIAVEDFLAGPRLSPGDHAGGFRTILFTDIEGHTAMMSRLGDADGRAVLREHERRTREALVVHGGTEVKAMGDGFMASFRSAQDALRCALAVQEAFAGPIAGEQLRVRIGVNAGEPIAEDDDLFGASVIAAARIAALAKGGQVLVANVVRELVAGKGFLFADTGEHLLRGMEDHVRVWELRSEP